jgi:hypothetical protein
MNYTDIAPFYNANSIITYVFYDTNFTKYLEKMNLFISDIDTKEFENNYDITNTLYSTELSYIFNLKNPDDISSVCHSMFNPIKNSILNECLYLLVEEQTKQTGALSLVINACNSKDEKLKAVFPLLFSYDFLFFTHICIKDLLINGYIDVSKIDLLKQVIIEFSSD